MGEAVGAKSTPGTPRPDRSSTPVTPRPASASPRPPISAPPSQFHSPSLSRSPLLTPDHIVPSKTPRSSTPRNATPRIRTPRFITPLGSPLRRALQLTKLDPQDAWLPITESRNGNAWYAAFHCLCSGIGFQALVLPVAFTVLGWAWGIIALTVAYLQIMSANFGEKKAKWLGLFPILYLSIGTCVALNIIGGSTSKLFFQTVCGQSCTVKTLTPVEWYLVFASAAVLLSQLPNLNSIAGVSLIGSITAVVYCTLMWMVSVNKDRLPGITYKPVRGAKEIDRFFEVLNSLGIIAFAFRGHNLVLEIQATMPSSEKHPSRVPMWKGAKAAYAVIAACLFPLAIGGFWAYGQRADVFLISRFRKNGGLQSAFYAYRRNDTSQFIMGLVSLLIIINALSSFQIYAMPMFDELESIFTKRMKKPCQWWLRIILRAVFGYGVFFLAIAIPSIGSVGGLVGGISLPVTLAYPCFMWLKMKKPKKYGKMWYLNWSLGITGLILSVLFMAAGVFVIKENDSKFEWFKPK
ncbi:LYSINE HISTIDINE TRANSPORTER-LIKE 8 [Salix purpurea]|uniref:LYSINE HISTIDINE TRANSPORTER-LIKE 8 n=1 Tax=Salix purpurea TaxID=77065 RepID=A0A9Q0PRS8_SALPP|nr:LYSINE HISTIDINE TRANSPORTER-LIKE 8 [Salix purpurea]